MFDASAAGRNGVSLNDCMEAGPNLMPSLPEILVRFRRRKIGLTADITKAFLQVGISDSDRYVSRFLWKLDGTVRVMRFTRVPFGNKSSPFLYVCVPSQTQGVQWYGGSPSHRSCVASAFHAPRRCASATSW